MEQFSSHMPYPFGLPTGRSVDTHGKLLGRGKLRDPFPFISPTFGVSPKPQKTTICSSQALTAVSIWRGVTGVSPC